MTDQKYIHGIFVHYGHDHFEKNRFMIPKNRPGFNKPSGGLWASPEDAPYGWKEWNESEEYAPCEETNCFRFHLSENARVLVIDSVEKAKKMLKSAPLSAEMLFLERIGMGYILPDFERLAKDYDAILYLQSSDRRLYNAMYGWDCDSILILAPDVVMETKKGE